MQMLVSVFPSSPNPDLTKLCKCFEKNDSYILISSGVCIWKFSFGDKERRVSELWLRKGNDDHHSKFE